MKLGLGLVLTHIPTLMAQVRDRELCYPLDSPLKSSRRRESDAIRTLVPEASPRCLRIPLYHIDRRGDCSSSTVAIIQDGSSLIGASYTDEVTVLAPTRDLQPTDSLT
ncbi:hypothetical protein GGR57DRAFT_474897 [Xylariaceae sp. FL1272]|nr:hypothetical protein GGR57DRAFT_474897 [Xylariaceae sp. FL1272]